MIEFQKQKTAIGYVEATPRPTQQELNDFYSEQYYGAGVSATYHTQYSDDEVRQKQLRAATNIEAISQGLGIRSNISFLEIGTGEGFLLADAMKRGWNCHGTDFQRMPVEKFNPSALSVFKETDPGEYLDACIRKKEKFSVVALQNVLEHALHPDTLLRNIRDILEPEGLCFVQVPNDYSRLQEIAAAKGLIEHEYWFLPPQHLNYFNTETLAAYVAHKGFTLVDAFSDFPIEFYLWGNVTNYTKDRKLGPLAHKARVELDLLMAEAGLRNYLDFYRALYRVGQGRNICVLLKSG